jgi:hypothetical protein
MGEYHYTLDSYLLRITPFAVTDLEEWVSYRKDDIESFLLGGWNSEPQKLL